MPTPTSLSTAILPPCKSTAFLTMAKPSPVPEIVPTLLALWNESNSLARSFSGMPIPRSRTLNSFAATLTFISAIILTDKGDSVAFRSGLDLLN